MSLAAGAFRGVWLAVIAAGLAWRAFKATGVLQQGG